jgi:PleD family two-component response regulator
MAEYLKQPQTSFFGMATFYKPLASVDEMIRIVDDLMYKGKKSGKNSVMKAVYS